MNTETPQDQLEQAKTHLEQEEIEEALRIVNILIDTADLLAAHQLRVTILLPNIKQPDILRKSLDVLQHSDPVSYEKHLTDIEARIYERASEIQHKLSDATSRKYVSEYLQTMDDLSIFGDLFPSIHLARGLGYITVARIPRSIEQKENQAPYEILRKLIAAELGENIPSSHQTKETTPSEDTQQIKWYESAHEAFQTALDSFPEDHPLRGETYEILGALYRTMENYPAALKAYQQAGVHGRFLGERIDEMVKEVASIGQSLVLKHVDQLVAIGNLDAAHDMLQQYLPTPIPDVWHLRLAEVALLRNDNEKAIYHYQILLNINDKTTD